MFGAVVILQDTLVGESAPRSGRSVISSEPVTSVAASFLQCPATSGHALAASAFNNNCTANVIKPAVVHRIIQIRCDVFSVTVSRATEDICDVHNDVCKGVNHVTNTFPSLSESRPPL